MQKATIQKQKLLIYIRSFLKQNNLINSCKTLQSEASLPPFVMDQFQIKKLKSSIIKGAWDYVIRVMDYYNLTNKIQFEMTKLIIFDLLEVHCDIQPAIKLFNRLKNKLGVEFFNELVNLQNICQIAVQNYNLGKGPQKVVNSIARQYEKSGFTKIESRQNLAEDILQTIANQDQSARNPNRLLELVLKGLKQEYLQSIGFSQIENKSNQKKHSKDFQDHDQQQAKNFQQDTIIDQVKLSINTKGKQIQSLSLNKNGSLLAVGTIDGFVQLWNPVELMPASPQYLGYDQQQNPLIHQSPVLCLKFSQDNQKKQSILCSSDQDGNIRIWDIIKQGKLLKQIDSVFSKGISCMQIVQGKKKKKRQKYIICGSFEGVIKMIWLNSGSTFYTIPNAHQSFINDFIYIKQNSKLITASSDGFVKIWEVALESSSSQASHNEILSIQPSNIERYGKLKTTVVKIQQHPYRKNIILIVGEGQSLWLADLASGGKLVRQFYMKESTGQEGMQNIRFSSACFSNNGQYIYAVSQQPCKMFILNDQMKCIKILEIKSGQDSIAKSIGAIKRFPDKNILLLNLMDDQILQIWGSNEQLN